jgi:hypothetical protein
MAAKWWMTVLVAVIAIVAGIVVWSFLGDDGEVATGDTTTTAATDTTGTTTTEVDVTTTAVEETTTTGDSTTTTGGDGTTTTAGPIGMATAAEAVLAWIDALAAGDLDTAWALMDEAAQEGIGGRAAFGALRADLEEGFGVWARAEDRVVHVAVVEMASESEIEVVTLVGAVTGEGETTASVVAVPAILRGGEGFQALPFVRGDQVEFVSPPPLDPVDPDVTPPIAVDGTIVVVVPDTATLVVLSVDDELVLELGGDDLVPAGEGDARATSAIDPPIDVGRHALTVVYLDGEVVHADAILFEAVG